jgi:F420H(2)-dependent quinone reductase
MNQQGNWKMNLNTYARRLMRAAPLLNMPVTAMANSRLFGRIVGRNVAIITYTGRRSGRTISTPVSYRRTGDELQIAANMPEVKNWWRNFLGDGAPLSVRLNGIDRVGHAVAHRDTSGHVTVQVRLGTS